MSSYNYVGGNPISRIDPDGRSFVVHYYDGKGKERKATYDGEKKAFFDKKGNEVTDNDFVNQVLESFEYLEKADEAGIIGKIAGSKKKVHLQEMTEVEGAFFGTGIFGGNRTVAYNTTSGLKTTVDKMVPGLLDGKPTRVEEETGGKQSPALGFYHELGHAYENIFNRKEQKRRSNQSDATYDDMEERYIIDNYENPAAKRLSEAGRLSHGGIPFRTTGPTSTEEKND